MKNGCDFGHVSREMILGTKEDLVQIRANINEIKLSCEEIKLRYSQRIPSWATVVISVLVGLIGIFAGMGL